MRQTAQGENNTQHDATKETEIPQRKTSILTNNKRIFTSLCAACGIKGSGESYQVLEEECGTYPVDDAVR